MRYTARPDFTAREVGQRLAEALRQQVVVDNRPGAGATLGHGLAAKAPASSEQGSRLRDANVREQGESAVG